MLRPGQIISAVCCLAVLFSVAGAVLAESVSLRDRSEAPKIVVIHAEARNRVLKRGDSTTLRIRVRVDPKYHIQSNTPTEDWVIPTTLEIKVPPGWKAGEVVYPKAKMMEFSFAKGKKWSVFGSDFTLTAKVTAPTGPETHPLADITTTLRFQACDDSQCLPPGETESSAQIEIADVTSESKWSDEPGSVTPAATSEERNYFAEILKGNGWLSLFGWVYIAGLGLSLTPCVFPLIPVTLGYFRNQASDNRKRTVLLALTYVVGIGLTYSVLGAMAAATGALFGSWLSNPVVLGTLAALVVVMAFSMFGLFELRPPAFIASRSSARAGFGGALVMGLIFGIVAAPCTGPATIALLAFVGALGKPLLGVALFFCLALGLTTPLLLLAVFSGNLPRSGMWMVWVKKLLGVMLLGVAIWLVLPVIGSRIAAVAGGVVAAGAAVWLGLVDRSGYRPIPFGILRMAALAGGLVLAAVLIFPAKPAPGIKWTAWSEEAEASAAADIKPLMIDFTAEWCAPCHELEAGAFRHPEAVRLSEGFVRLRIDVTDADSPRVKALHRRYKVQGVPAVLFFDKTGAERRDLRIESNVTGDDLAKRMREVRS